MLTPTPIATSQAAAYLLLHADDGVYLGSFAGFGFWSKLDPVGQGAACAFKSSDDAMNFAAGLDNSTPNKLTTTKVIADQGLYASIAACVAAGVDEWNPSAPYSDESLEVQQP